MRVLHFCTSFSPLSETFIYDYISELEQRGVENHVVTCKLQNLASRPFGRLTLINPAERLHPGRLLRRLLGRMRGDSWEVAAWAIERRRLGTVVDRVRPDVVHAQFGQAGAKMAPVAAAHCIPMVVSFHGIDATSHPRSVFWRQQYNALWPTTAFISGPSRYICQKLLALGAPREKLIHMPYGVNLAKFNFACPSDRFDGKTIDCLFVGRLVEKKGPLLLLKAFKSAMQLVSPQLTLRLNIVGEGPLMQRVRAYLIENDLERHVLVLGAQSHENVKLLMESSHLYIQHSVTARNGDQEGLPVSIIEAAATGLPIVATRHSGIPEIVIDGKNGYLVEEGDFEAMADRIRFLAESTALWTRMSEEARRHIETYMDIDQVVRRWLEILQSTIVSYQKRPLPHRISRDSSAVDDR
jgi:colanic acid/amylovoran biosynthesis glycosyltransferase